MIAEMPDREKSIIANRLREHQRNMTAMLLGCDWIVVGALAHQVRPRRGKCPRVLASFATDHTGSGRSPLM
ncbi:MAG: hypothetical protein ACRDRW_00290 [Pseudonocardiaceae bacterium]